MRSRRSMSAAPRASVRESSAGWHANSRSPVRPAFGSIVVARRLDGQNVLADILSGAGELEVGRIAGI